METIRVNGVWWLPELPEDKVGGELTFARESGGRLQLLGSLGSEHPLSAKRTDPKVVLGVGEDGTEVTLIEPEVTGTKWSDPGFVRHVLETDTVVLGHHFERADDIKIVSVDVSYSHLTAWIDQYPFRASRPPADNGDCLQVSHERPRYEPVTVAPGVSLGLRFRALISEDRDGDSLTIAEVAFLSFKFDSPVTVGELVGTYVRRLQLFLSFATSEAVLPRRIECIVALPPSDGIQPRRRLRADGVGTIELAADGTTHVVRVNVRSTQFLGEAPTLPSRRSRLSLVRFEDVSEKLGTFVATWFEQYLALKSVFDLYSAARYLPSGSFLEHHFLTYAQALESYHRLTEPDASRYLPKGQFRVIRRALVDALPADIPEEVRNAYCTTLSHMNGVSLRRRIGLLLDSLGDVPASFIDDRTSFVQLLVDTRNYLTHYTTRREKTATSAEMYTLTQLMRRLLEACFLRDIGFEPPAIVRALDGVKRPLHPLRPSHPTNSAAPQQSST